MIARALPVLAALLLALCGKPGFAALPALPAGDAAPQPAQSAAPAIAAEQEAGQDAQIERRIAQIFAAIEPLRQVEVAVEQGVVTLSGSVAQAEDREQAETIAGRVAGVVTVDNAIARDLAVDRNLAPTLGAIGEQARAIVRLLPLLGVALGVAIVIALLFFALARVRGLWLRIMPNAFLAELVASALRFIGVLVGIYVALKILGATALLTAVLGISGVIGIAIGFAVRDTIDNYISSVMLSMRQPFRANDHVVIEGEEGRVVRLTSRATVLMTLDGNHLRIPNSTVFKAVILNYTRNPQRRFAIDLGVDADDDPLEAMAVGLAALRSLPFVLEDPEPSAMICEIGESNIALRFLGWVDQRETDFLKGRSLAINAAKSTLEEAGFALPEPIYRLRFDPRTAPMPTTSADAAVSRTRPAEAAERRQRAPQGAREETQSTRPEDHVAAMVERERAETGEKDLLDSRRPIE